MRAPDGKLRLDRFLLGLMAVFFLVVNLTMFAGFRIDELLAGLALGVIAAEITLCAVFAALAPVSAIPRITAGMVGAIMVCLAISRMEIPGNDGRVVLIAAAFSQWIAVQIPLWVFRLRSGWYLRITTEETAGLTRQDMQFGIRQLMVWTGVVAVVLSISKTVVTDEETAVGALLAVFNSLAAWPMIWAAFVRSRMLIWCGVAVVCSVILCYAELLAFRAVIGPGVDIKVFVAMHLIQLVAVGGSLLLIRLNGVRLVRVADSDTGTSGAAHAPWNGE